jgi:hypothetical protein
MPEVSFHIAFKGEGLNVASHLFENAVPDALGETIPDHHVLEGLTLIVGSAGGIDHADHTGFVRQVVHGLADFFQAGLEGLPVSVVGFIRKNSQLRQTGNGL